MKNPYSGVALAFLVLFIGCEGRTGGGRISLISLAAQPDRFVGKEVTVVGYHASGLEPPLLYVTKEHSRLNDWPSGVVLYETIEGMRFSELRACQDQYLMVVGFFTLLPTEEYGITDIVRVVALGDGHGDSKICFSSERTERDREETAP